MMVACGTVTVEVAVAEPPTVVVVVAVAKKVVRDVHWMPTGNWPADPSFWRAIILLLPFSGSIGILPRGLSARSIRANFSATALRFLAEKPGVSARAVKPDGAGMVRVMPAIKVVLRVVVAVVKLWTTVEVDVLMNC